MKLPLLLPAWMLAAGLLAGQTVPAAPQPPADNAIRNDEVERPVLVFEHDLSPGSNGVHLCKGEHEAWVNIVINTSSINSCFKGTIGHHLTIGPPLPQYRFDYQVFFKGGDVDLAAKLFRYYYSVTQDGRQIGFMFVAPNQGTAQHPIGKFHIGGMALTLRRQPDYDMVQQAARLGEVQARPFDARVLFCSFGNFLWLKGRDAGTDLFYEYRVDTVDGVQPATGLKLYTAAEFKTKFRGPVKTQADNPAPVGKPPPAAESPPQTQPSPP